CGNSPESGHGAGSASVAEELVAEDAQGTREQADRAVGVLAGAATDELAAPAFDPGQVVEFGMASGETFGRVGDRPEPEDARAALGGALAGHVAHDPGRGGHAAGVRREERDDAAA